MADKFLYFAFGSNMLEKRIHIHNPSAVRQGMGKLMNWQLDFAGYANNWDGAPATIVPVKDSTVLGSIWEMDKSSLQNLDEQEGVSLEFYYPEDLPILLHNNEKIMARVYIMTKNPNKPLHEFKNEDIPFERQPSKTYLQCLVKGAIETELPSSYVEKLKSIKHNGRISLVMEEKLELKNIVLTTDISNDVKDEMSQTFLYFGYSSNMLAKRLQTKTPSAVRIGYGTLEDWAVDFNGFLNYWDGAPATITPDENATVMGAVWEIDVSDLENLNIQEEKRGQYNAVTLPILSEHGEDILARVYIMSEQPKKPLNSFAIENADIPFERLPSKTYLECMVKGALETGIPGGYIDKLKCIKHNGRISQNLQDELELKDIKLYN